MNIGPRTLTRKTFACALACLLLAPVSTFARTVAQKKQAARAQLETAERLRDSLESKPETQRTRRDFQKVIVERDELTTESAAYVSVELRPFQPRRQFGESCR